MSTQRTRSPTATTPRLTTTNATASSSNLYLGIDFGTSGARRCLIDSSGTLLHEEKVEYSSRLPPDMAWSVALMGLLSLPDNLSPENIVALAIDGTSSTTLLIDKDSGEVLAPPKMYNEKQSEEVTNIAKAIAPKGHTVTSNSSTLAKVLTWHTEGLLTKATATGMTPAILHQADWLASLIHGHRHVTDWNNCLKLGFDCETLSYPPWLASQEYASVFPSLVVAPGTPVARILPAIAEQTGLSPNTVVCAGTTDSIAAFLAAGVTQPGQAVTSLGSTLAIKLLSTQRVEDVEYGVYSHRLGDTWLVGGASNSGGAALRQLFTDDQLKELTPRIDAEKPTGLEYVVLPTPSPGERFPINAPTLQPKLEPRPEDDAVFLQGMLEAMARTEGEAYKVLKQMGATAVTEVYTAGGGSNNPVWTKLREKEIGVKVRKSEHGEAAYGAALLAKSGYEKNGGDGKTVL